GWTKLRGKPDAETAEALYRELAPLGTTLQVSPDMWPADRKAFAAYWARGLEELQIDDTVRSYLTALTDLKFLHPVIRVFFAPLNRFLTAGFLPPQVRDQMKFAWGPSQQRRFDGFIAVVGGINRFLPRFIRQAPYQLTMMDFRWRLRKGTPLV
ncbi:MAG: DUF2236 domain-containing protein, partial [Polyangiaceae bacterium]|nr:DUF2236 domain-containing protein [Polyangiaceae bacterium]